MEIARADIKELIDKINCGEVSEGYKKMKVGIIPDDWNVRKLDDVVEINPKKEVLLDANDVINLNIKKCYGLF